MGVMAGMHCKVWVQTPDGQVVEIDAMSVDIEHEMDYNGVVRTRMEFEALGQLTWVDHVGYLEKVTHAAEWQCSYCGRPNQRERETCKGCGSVRPFVYD